jgi:hypothetical protein
MYRPSYLQKELVKAILLASLMMLIGFVVITNTDTIETVQAYSSGPPGGVTGAPGDFGTCANCHFGPAPNGQFTISAPQMYVPGQTYQITVTHTNSDSTRKRWGFELTALSSGNKAGDLQNLSASTQILNNDGPNSNRQYVEHSANGTFPDQLGGATWTFNWVAPATNVGNVTLYAAGNQANKDGDTSGDQIYTTQVTVAPSTPVANSIQFDNSTYSVGEGAGFATITVTRSGDTSGTATVDFETADVSARQRTDYTIAAGTVTFAAGDTSKTFRVLTSDDVYVEGNETIDLSLSNPTGGTVLGSQATAVLTITDNDSTSPSVNPLDDTRFFIQQHYYDFLARYPDTGGWDFWIGTITQCGSDPNCIHNKRIDASNAFFYELEFQQTGSYVYRVYRASFGNDQPFPNPNPDPQHPGEEKKVPLYLRFMKDRARVRGGSQLAQLQLSFANVFVLRPEFLTKYPASLDGPSFVDAILATILNDIGADLGSQRQALIDLYTQAGGGNAGRGSVLYRLADDNVQQNPINNRAFIDAEYNRAFVFTQYAGYLRRNPDMPGFLFWLSHVNAAPLRDVPHQHAMVCSFITSSEYQLRFSSVVTHSNTECPQ